jgi:hypothetical protein
MVGSWFFSHVHRMELNPFSPDAKQKSAKAQLFGGVERESQMHPGSSLFKTEH